jgi:hypothetical protein
MARRAAAPAEETAALYVRLPRSVAERLDRAAFELKAAKRDIVTGLVSRYVDPTSAEGLTELGSLAAARVEIPPPREPETRPATPPRAPGPPVVSRASDWVAGMQREIREYAASSGCPAPLVRLTLDDGERCFLQALRAGPGDDHVVLVLHPVRDGQAGTVIVHLDAVRRVDILAEPPTPAEEGFVFRPRTTPVGFAGGD